MPTTLIQLRNDGERYKFQYQDGKKEKVEIITRAQINQKLKMIDNITETAFKGLVFKGSLILSDKVTKLPDRAFKDSVIDELYCKVELVGQSVFQNYKGRSVVFYELAENASIKLKKDAFSNAKIGKLVFLNPIQLSSDSPESSLSDFSIINQIPSDGSKKVFGNNYFKDFQGSVITASKLNYDLFKHLNIKVDSLLSDYQMSEKSIKDYQQLFPFICLKKLKLKPNVDILNSVSKMIDEYPIRKIRVIEGVFKLENVLLSKRDAIALSKFDDVSEPKTLKELKNLKEQDDDCCNPTCNIS